MQTLSEAHAGCFTHFIMKSTVSESVEGCMPSVTFCFGCHDPRAWTVFSTSHVQRRMMPEKNMTEPILVARGASTWKRKARKGELLCDEMPTWLVSDSWDLAEQFRAISLRKIDARPSPSALGRTYPFACHYSADPVLNFTARWFTP
jgi:hypothetical protein